MYQPVGPRHPEHMLDGLRVVTEAALASPWLLAVIGVLAVVDALLPVVPSEALIIAAGVASATGGQNLWAVIVAAGAGAFVGEVAGYLIGRGIGPGMRTRLRPGGARATAYGRVEGLLARRGGTILLTARFVPAGRTAATLAAGATAYPPARFLLFTALGAPLSAAYQALLGRVGGAAFAHDTVTALLVSFGLAAAVTLLIEGARRLTAARTASSRSGSAPEGRSRRRVGAGDRDAQEAVKTIECCPVAPSGTTAARSSVWVTPPPSVARTCTTCEPVPTSTTVRHIRQVTPLTSVASSVSIHRPSSTRTSTRLIPTGCDQAIPAIGTRPARVLPNGRGVSIRDCVFTGPRSPQPRCNQ